eukprot:566148-Rhodomonas_salina.2
MFRRLCCWCWPGCRDTKFKNLTALIPGLVSFGGIREEERRPGGGEEEGRLCCATVEERRGAEGRKRDEGEGTWEQFGESVCCEAMNRRTNSIQSTMYSLYSAGMQKEIPCFDAGARCGHGRGVRGRAYPSH